MRVLICSQTYYRKENGQAVFTIRLAEGLVKAGHNVMVIAPSEKGRDPCSIVNGVIVQTIPAIHIVYSINLTLFPRRFIEKILIEFYPDIIHIQDFFILSYTMIDLARQLKVPIVGTSHFQPLNWIEILFIPQRLKCKANSLIWSIMLSVFNRLDAASVPTKTASAILHKQAIRVPVKVISCGVDHLEFHPLPNINKVATRQYFNIASDKPVLLYVGRLDRDKGLDCLVQAAKLLENINVEIVIAGKGLLQKYYYKKTKCLGLLKRVIFLGYVRNTDLPLLLNCVNAFILPGLAELQSIATLEAMSCGLPIIVANAGALPELIEHNINGFMFKPGDPVDLAEKIKNFLFNSARWKRMGQSSQQKVQQHDISKTILEYIDWYKDILKKQSLVNLQ